MYDASLAPVLGRLKEGLAWIYGKRLRGVYLFGSYAREEADEESDVDLLIVLDRVDNYAEEIERTSDLIAELSLQADRSICCVYISEENWNHEESMFLRNVRQEAIPA